MGTMQLLFLMLAFIIAGNMNLSSIKLKLNTQSLRAEEIVLEDMYYVSTLANKFYDVNQTYIGFNKPGWIEDTPYGNITISIIDSIDINISGNTLLEPDSIFSATCTPSGYILN